MFSNFCHLSRDILLIGAIVFMPITSALSDTVPNVDMRASLTTSPPLFKAQTTTLRNGLQVVIVVNPRAPVVTHMLWIRAGGADESTTDSGVAHYLEHLMFKGTKRTPPGEYSRRIAAMGGNENAFTGQDYTAYFVTIAPEHLPDVMALERDRFMNLNVPLEHAKSELAVVREERRQRTENDPLGGFYEQMSAVLHASTSYDNPIIGWADDIERLTWAKAKTFKDTWYHPRNMMLVISGAIDLPTATALANKYYGDWPDRPIPPRERMMPPVFTGQTSLEFTSDQINQPQLLMAWRAPSYHQYPAMSRTLSVMAEIMDGGAATRLYQTLVVKQKRASSIDLSYDDAAWGDGTIWISAVPMPGISLEQLGTDITTALKQASTDITDDEVKRAITRLQRSALFARDSVAGPAMTIGEAWATGATLEQIENWPRDLAMVNTNDVRTAISHILTCAPDKNCAPPVIGNIIPQKTAHQKPIPVSHQAPSMKGQR